MAEAATKEIKNKSKAYSGMFSPLSSLQSVFKTFIFLHSSLSEDHSARFAGTGRSWRSNQ
jgi:hypothetical protein